MEASLRVCEKEKNALLSLKGTVTEHSEIVADDYHFEADQMRITFKESDLPKEWKGDVELYYNRNINDLAQLLFGARSLVRNAVVRNVEKHLLEINTAPSTNSEKWVLGSYKQPTLSQVMADALEEPILKGHRVDKTLFDSIDDEFYGNLRKAMAKKGCRSLKTFFAELNQELEEDRKHGILKGVSQKRKDILRYTDKLVERIDSRIEELDQSIEDNIHRKKKASNKTQAP